MSNSKKARRNRRRYDEESHTSHRISLSGKNDAFELYAEDVWDGDDMGRFAKSRWSAGPKKRRSEWLRQRLDEAAAGFDDDLGYIDLTA